MATTKMGKVKKALARIAKSKPMIGDAKVPKEYLVMDREGNVDQALSDRRWADACKRHDENRKREALRLKAKIDGTATRVRKEKKPKHPPQPEGKTKGK